MTPLQTYNLLFYVFTGIAILGLALAIFFFFHFDIPTVYAMMTGKAKKETIRRMEAQNAMTGKLRMEYPGHTGNTGKSGKIGKTGKTGLTGRVGGVRKGVIVNPAPQPPRPETTPETGVLQTAAPETSVLQNSETAVLFSSDGETAPLKPVTQAGQAPAYTPAAPVEPDFRFLVTERTLVIHTNEII